MEWVAARRAMGAIPAAQNRHFLGDISRKMLVLRRRYWPDRRGEFVNVGVMGLRLSHVETFF
jgi:hypothetical protein